MPSNNLIARCFLAWVIFSARGRDRTPDHGQGSSGLVEAAVTRSDPHYSNKRHRDRRNRSAHSIYNFPWSERDQQKRPLYWNDHGQAEGADQILKKRLRYIFGSPNPDAPRRKNRNKSTKFWVKPEPFRASPVRQLENGNDDKYYDYDDDGKKKNGDDDKAGDDDGGGDDRKASDDLYSAADERCSAFLVSFLEGTTDAHDTCEGMMNAYTAAGM